MNIKGKKIGIMGFKRSGQAAARLAMARGCNSIMISSNADFLEQEMMIIDKNNLEYEMPHSGKLLECDIIIVSPGIPFSNDFIVKAIDRGISVMPEIEFAYALTNARIAGITGTNGKSTTAHLMHQLLLMDGINNRLGGNISPGTPLSDIVADDDTDIIVCELSSFQLEHISHFRPFTGIITNISPDHLDRHGSMDNYVKAKLRMFENHDSSNTAILNADDPLLKELDIESTIIYTSMSDSSADIYCSGDYMSLPSSTVSLSGFKLPGRHNIANLMQAAGGYLSLGGHEENLEQFVGSLSPMVHRMEYIGTFRGHRMYNNSMCTNPVAFSSSVKSLKRDQIVIAGGRNKDFDISLIIDAIVSSTAGAVLIGETAPILSKRLIKRNFTNIKTASDIREAIEYAFELAQDNAPINFSPGFSSFDMFSDFNQRGNIFKEEAGKWA